MGATTIFLILTAWFPILLIFSGNVASAQTSRSQDITPSRIAVGRKLHQLPIRKPTNNTPLATTGGLCGPIHDHVCNKQCCSRNFYCGNEEEHCALRLGCLEDWGVCGGRYVSLPTQPTVAPKDRKPLPDSKSKMAYAGYDKCGPEFDAYGLKPFCCSKYRYCGNSSDHCERSLGCVEGWGACTGPAPPSTAAATVAGPANDNPTKWALPPAQIAGIAISSFGALCGISGLIIRLIRNRQQSKAINIAVPMSTTPSIASLQLSSLSRSSRSSSGSLSSVVALLHGVTNSVQQGVATVKAKTAFVPKD